MNCNSASAIRRFLSFGHLERRLDSAVLAQRQLLCEEGVNGLDGGDIAALDAVHGEMENSRSLASIRRTVRTYIAKGLEPPAWWTKQDGIYMAASVGHLGSRRQRQAHRPVRALRPFRTRSETARLELRLRLTGPRHRSLTANEASAID